MSTTNTNPSPKTDKPGRSPRGPPRLTSEQCSQEQGAWRAHPAGNQRSQI